MNKKNGMGPSVHWKLWKQRDEKPNGKGRIFSRKCSICTKVMEVAVIFPEAGLNICYECLGKIAYTIFNNLAPSDQKIAESALKSVLDLSRSDTLKEV